MKMFLQNGLKVSAVPSLSGQVQQVAASLEPLKMQGYVVVQLYGNGNAQEVCISQTSGFVSIKNYHNNMLSTEMFRDVLHQKTFYYTYHDGKVVETSMDSQNKTLENNTALPRDVMTHAPVALFEGLQSLPQQIANNEIIPAGYIYSKQKEHSRTAA